MKLAKELQTKVDRIKSKDGITEPLAKTKWDIENAGIVLEDSELDTVSGGWSFNKPAINRIQW